METGNALRKQEMTKPLHGEIPDQKPKGRKKNQRLKPRYMAAPPKHPINRWLMAANEKYDVKKDWRFNMARTKGGPAPIGDGRYVNIPPRKRNIRSERELAITVCRKLFIAFLNVFPFDDHVPFEVELSSWALARYGNMLREYEKDYDEKGVYRHGRVACDIFYGAIKDMALAGHIAPLTSRVEEGERKGYYKPTRIYLTRLFFESMGVDPAEVRAKQQSYKRRLLEKGQWQAQCRKQADRLVKRLKRANLDEMKSHERDRLLAQIERCRKTVDTPVAQIEHFRTKVRNANKKVQAAGELEKAPSSVEELMIKAAVFDPIVEEEKLAEKEIRTLKAVCEQIIERKMIPTPDVMGMTKQAEEMADAVIPLIGSKIERLEWEQEKQHQLIELLEHWHTGWYSPPS